MCRNYSPKTREPLASGYCSHGRNLHLVSLLILGFCLYGRQSGTFKGANPKLQFLKTLPLGTSVPSTPPISLASIAKRNNLRRRKALSSVTPLPELFCWSPPGASSPRRTSRMGPRPASATLFEIAKPQRTTLAAVCCLRLPSAALGLPSAPRRG
jgi:hypothetical protein